MKVSSAFIIVIGVYVLALRILVLIAPHLFPSFSIWVAENPAIRGPLALTYRWAGIFIIAIAISLFGIGETAYRKGGKRSWYTLLAYGLVGWLCTAALFLNHSSPYSVCIPLIGVQSFS